MTSEDYRPPRRTWRESLEEARRAITSNRHRDTPKPAQHFDPIDYHETQRESYGPAK